MKKIFNIIVILFIVTTFLQTNLTAQSVAVGTPVIEDYYRRLQLLGKVDEDISFVIRPLNQMALTDYDNVFYPEYRSKRKRFKNTNSFFEFGKGKGLVKILPISLKQQYNSHHPEGFNDGAMIPARGYQNLLSLGIFAKYGVLSLQFQHEFVYAQNKSFEGYKPGYVNPLGLVFPSSPNRSGIDFPERFGENSYSKFFWGQSSIRVNFGAVSFGFSNENLWWGPGMHNSLLMTNTSPGFKHFTFNTIKPLKTPIGSFEWQLIGGRLDGSGYTAGLPDDWRYINAMVLSYQPKWVKGLFLGLIRSFTIYKNDLGGGIGDYLPVFDLLTKISAGGSDEDAKRRDQIASIFMRWVWPKSNVEVYVEYGRSDHAWDTRDLIVESSHSDAYIIGLRKLITLNNNKDKYIQINAELTHLESNAISLNRDVVSWYEHGLVLHGHTHQGQILGAGIGPGSNLQTLNISWVQSLKSIGIQFERYVHNNDFFQRYVKDIRENWVDLSATAFATWNHNNLLFDVKFRFVQSYNYQWVYTPKLGDPSYFWEGEGWDVFNLQAQLGVVYRF